MSVVDVVTQKISGSQNSNRKVWNGKTENELFLFSGDVENRVYCTWFAQGIEQLLHQWI